ncbi:MAG: flagellar hook-associated protein FlgK [Desulfobulbaceae bacterium]|jgi:flagellar hook-associated protein 1 FlgK|nr:flagellar hook-associated protein FlgK [Desulfobulbaceae bacterium]
MAGLVTSLNSARTSLEVSQKQIEIVGNNIANVNTQGYSRQSAQLTPYPSMNFGDFFIGQGVRVTDVKRDHDVFVTNQLIGKSADYGYQSGQAQPLSELERLFAVGDENIATDVDKYFDAWQELSAYPSDLVLRDALIQRGQQLATDFNNTANSLKAIQSNINDTLIAKVDGVNSMVNEIAELNDRIFTIEVHGQTANTARDRRDELAKQLAEVVGAQSYEDSKGMMAVQLPGGLPLVQGTDAMRLEAKTNGGDLNITLHAGGVERALGQKNMGGEFKGLSYIRDSFIPDLMSDLDRMSYEISTQVNAQHAAGAGLDSVSGRDFFSVPPNANAAPPANPWDGAARAMAVSITDAAQIAAAEAPASGASIAPGDNRNALIMSNIGENYLIDGIDNFNSFYGKMTSRIGLETNQNQLSLQGAEDAVTQLENLRDGLSGVSLDEEMIDLIVYQRSYQSSAKFLSTIDELMESLLSIKQ